VGVFDLLVGAGKTIACVVDLLLGEILDHEEVLNGVARFAQLAVSCDDVGAVDHETRLPPTRRGVGCDWGCATTSLCRAGGVLCSGCRRRVAWACGAAEGSDRVGHGYGEVLQRREGVRLHLA